MTTDQDEDGGYGRPPRAGRFRKGTSGHPAGRPKGSRRQPPYESVLGQSVTVREAEGPRHVTAEEAFLLRLSGFAMKSNNAAMRAVEKLRELRISLNNSSASSIPDFIVGFVEPGSVNTALEPLKMGRILDRYREENARVVLEPWLVEAALARFGDRRLSVNEQTEVLQATRTPKKVNWPDWWEVMPKT